MIKYIFIFLILMTTTVDARYNKTPAHLNYQNVNDYMQDKNMKAATGECGQMSLEDYNKSLENLTKDEQRQRAKQNGDAQEEFKQMDYNKDGLVSTAEYRRYNLEREIVRPKTKGELKTIQRQQKKGEYKDPQEELKALTQQLDEVEKQKQPGKVEEFIEEGLSD